MWVFQINKIDPMPRKIRMGMVGGGRGAFIGAVHRMAAAIDGQIELVCGAFSSSPEKSKLSGEDFYLDPSRVYGSYSEMIEKEKDLPADVRMDFVSIVTPNHMHYGPAKMALDNGFHVVSDKPLCFDMEEALDLQKTVQDSGLIFALTHNYTGYPMVKQAKQMIKHGELGNIRKVVVEYPQGWLSTLLESTDQKQAAWRTDPKKSGKAGAMGFDNGARGILHASQISAGEENDLNIRVYGEKGGLAWSQMEPNSLKVKWLDKPTEIRRTGVGPLYPESEAHTRIPAGHPEGYLEAFGNIYRNVAKCIQARIDGVDVDPLYTDFPTVEDGVRGMHFIDKVIESGNTEDTKWIDM